VPLGRGGSRLRADGGAGVNSQILNGDWIEQLKTLESESVQCCVTSPPYWGLRDYGFSGQLGLEKTPEEYVKKMVAGFREVKRVLRNDGTLWLNLGDSYFSTQNSNRNGCDGSLGGKTRGGGEYKTQKRESDILKAKDLCGIPWRVAFALQADGWYLRQDIIWSKPNPMPESVTDRCTKSHEYIFLLTKSARYYYDNEAIKEDFISYNNPKSKGTRGQLQTTGARNGDRDFSGGFPYPEDGKNKRSVWTVNTKPYKEAHFATFPQEIPRTCILAGSKKGDTILDPFCGSGTTGEVALKLDRNFIGIELNQKYVNDLIIPRLDNVDPLFRMEE
jgi:DNA modification methylase